MTRFAFIFIILLFAFALNAQQGNCIFKSPQITINFGSGNVPDPSGGLLSSYSRVSISCPSDGYYSLAPYTSGCFRGDWHTLSEDHTAGDIDGNMLLVNVAPEGGVFLRTPISGLKSNTVYELCLWVINLCRPTKKCPSLLLPEINVRLETPEGKIVTSVVTGDLPRVPEVRWSPYRAYFTTPASSSTLMLVMSDNAPGGCGNDFALDDITFRECIKQTPQTTTTPKTASTTKKSTDLKPPPKKVTSLPKKKTPAPQVIRPETDTTSKTISVAKQDQKIVPSTPSILKTRENVLVRKIEIDAGEIKVEVYDNGQIDGDSVSIYHNNTLIKSHMRLSQTPISFTITVDPSQPHHEIIMVADNLGSIPPNTSVMIIKTAISRYELNISSSEQKNAKVVFDLKK